ncbi:MAG: arginine repressor [Acidobacteria bacterium]|nr:arginine repressor [Acidobacteriota bacterium]
MTKEGRQKKVMEIIRRRRIVNQEQIARELNRGGLAVDQSLVSRDLKALGIVKVKGCYRLPRPTGAAARRSQVLDIDAAGDVLLVVKTHPGRAQSVAIQIDQHRFDEIVGTVAGDDTIFVAVRGRDQQHAAIKHILELFRRERLVWP